MDIVLLTAFFLALENGQLQHEAVGWEESSHCIYHSYFISSHVSHRYNVSSANRAYFYGWPSATYVTDDDGLDDNVTPRNIPLYKDRHGLVV